MGEKRPTNEKIQIGDIFEHSCSTEDDHSVSFYQVVGKRGKTLVELRLLETEYYFDEKCNPAWPEIRVRPLPGQFYKNQEMFTVRTSSPYRPGYGEPRELHCLSGIGERNWMWYCEFEEARVYTESGWCAGNVIGILERQGKLPPRPGKS